MKLRHLILFTIACILLILAEFAWGPLLALFSWLQVAILLTQPELTKKAQLWGLRLFLISIPFVIFWGSIHSFLFIYQTEANLIFSIFALVLDSILSLIAAIYFVFTYEFAQSSDYSVSRSLNLATTEANKNKKKAIKMTVFILVFSVIPLLAADWKIVFTIMATHLYVYRHRLKQVVAAGF